MLWDFEIRTDHPIPSRRSGLVIVNSKKITFQPVDFSFLADQRLKEKESKNQQKYFEPLQKDEKVRKHEGGSETRYYWIPWNRSEEFENRLNKLRMNGETPAHFNAIFGYFEESRTPEETCCHQDLNGNHQLLLI